MRQPLAQTRKASRRFVALIGSVMLVGALVPASALPVAAEPDFAPVSAGGFLYYKEVQPQEPVGCGVIGLNITDNPFYDRNDCGSAIFDVVGAGSAATVVVNFSIGTDAPFHTQPATYDSGTTWEFDIVPEADWPAGLVTVTIVVDTVVVGSSSFGHNLLGATLSLTPDDSPYNPGEDIIVSGNIHEMSTTPGVGLERTGVAATFQLAVITPDGEVRPVGAPVAAGSNGNFGPITIPGATTTDLTATREMDWKLTIAVAAIDATYEDGSTGAWAAEVAGTMPVELFTVPTELDLHASFVSSVGWVQPGDVFPFRVFVRNATASTATNIVVTMTAPPSVKYLSATGLGDAPDGVVAGDGLSITWTIPTLAAPGEDGVAPEMALVVEAQAFSLAAEDGGVGVDPEIVWKDLSTTASMVYDGRTTPIESATHGPKVIPAAGGFDTARYGDKPFPIVPVEYVDLQRQNNHDAIDLLNKVNSPDEPGSTFNLYQEMSFNQLYPQASIPSANIATATFSEYDETADPDFTGWDFLERDPGQGTCRGATFGDADDPLTSNDLLVGTPAFNTRIEDGWYQLPGNTEFYGGDWPTYAEGLAGSIDAACGPLGKAVYDAAHIADPEIDYNDFDSDKDGVVDFFMLMFVGCGGNGASQEQGCPYSPPLGSGDPDNPPSYDNIWPHSSSLEQQFKNETTGLRGYVSDDQLRSLTEVPQCYLDESYLGYEDCSDAGTGGAGDPTLPVYVRVGPYNVNPETSFDTASVISHEYGHHLGLPDFYNSSEGNYYNDLNLMASDYSQHMTIFGKQELGWVVPDFLQPGDTENVVDWSEIKSDTGAINWQTPDGTPYTLSGANGDQNIHNGQAYGLKLPGFKIIATHDENDPTSVPSGTHVWWSGRGNDFGCVPTGAHNLDVYLPELTDVEPGTPVSVTFKSAWDIEWDWDYGFVMTSTDSVNYVSQQSENLPPYTTPSQVNPNNISCQTDHSNGITGESGAYAEGPQAVTLARAPQSPTAYTHGAVFVDDEYDISELVGGETPVLRFSYNTDGAFDRPGWFIDDIVVTVGSGDTAEIIYESDFETDAEEGRLFPGGCGDQGFKVSAICTAGWIRISSDALSENDHAYYLELRDRSGFDFNGRGQSDRGDLTWEPGVFLEYTNEIHGYGNNGVPPPPAQHYIDSAPIPELDCSAPEEPAGAPANCVDVAFVPVTGELSTNAVGDRSYFSDALNDDQPEGYINSFSDPDSKYEDGLWHFDYQCLTLDVTQMEGQDVGPEDPPAGNLRAAATLTAGDGCVEFGYGVPTEELENLAPIADAQAKPATAPEDEPILFDGSASTDDRQTPAELTYSWDFGDGTPAAEGATVQHAFAEAGEYTVELTVTDAEGLSDVATVTVTITAVPDQTGSPAPTDGGPTSPSPAPSSPAGQASPTPTGPAAGGAASPTPRVRFIPNTAGEWVVEAVGGNVPLLVLVGGSLVILGAIQYRGMRGSRR